MTVSEVQRDYGLSWAARRGLGEQLRMNIQSVMDLTYADAAFDRVMFLKSIIHMPEKDAISPLPGGGSDPEAESSFRRAATTASPCGSDTSRIGIRGGQPGVRLHRGHGLRGRDAPAAGGGGLSSARSREHQRALPAHALQWLQNLDRHAEEMEAVSREAYRMLRRYLMLALATYRSGRTLCHLIVAANPAA